MKKLSKSLFAVAAPAALLLASLQAQAEDIVVTSSGGIWLESAKQNFASCYEERTGDTAEILVGGSTDFLNRIRANPDNPPVDTVVLSEIDAIRAGDEGLLEKMTVEKVPNLKNVPEIFRAQWNNYATIQNFGAMIVMYNSEKITEPPKDWKTLIDNVIAGKYGDRVSFPALTYSWGPMFTWFLTSLYDGDEDMVFQKYKEMLPNMAQYWNSPVDALNLFAAKDIDILVYWDGRAYAFAEEHAWAGAYIPDPGAFQSAAMLAKVKNGSDSGWDYIDCVLSPEAQLGHSQMVKYPIVNQSVEYPEELAKVLTPLERVKQPPFREFMDKIPAWIERWNKEIR